MPSPPPMKFHSRAVAPPGLRLRDGPVQMPLSCSPP